MSDVPAAAASATAAETTAARGPAPTPAPAERPAAVEFRNVTKIYGQGTPREYVAISDVSFTIPDVIDHGEISSFLGPSGCGKSTVLRLVAGLEPQHPPTSGSVTVLGRSVVGPGADRGMVFQDYTSFDNRTVLDNVAFGLECRGVPRRLREAEAAEWIARVGLDPRRDATKYPHELSGGMRQRVAIARTLILRPRVILMDEPFAALDAMTREHMMMELQRIWMAAGKSVMFITHSIPEAVFLSDRIDVLSARPGRTIREFEVDLPRPRTLETMAEKPFAEHCNALRALFTDLVKFD